MSISGFVISVVGGAILRDHKTDMGAPLLAL